jgi:hypothetical protein
VQALLDTAFLEADFKVSGQALEIRFRNRESTPAQRVMEQSFFASVQAYIPEIKQMKPMQDGKDGKKEDAKPAQIKPETKAPAAKPPAKAKK